MLKKYKDLLNTYKYDNEIIDEIEFIQGSNYDYNEFKPGFFTKKNIKNYNHKLINNAYIFNNAEILDYGLENQNNYEKVTICLEHIPYINLKNLEKLDIKDLKYITEISKDYNIKDILKLKINNLNDFKMIINNKQFLKHLNDLCDLFNIVYLSPDFFQIISQSNFNNFMKILDKSYINSNSILNNLMDTYLSNKSLFNDDLLDKDIINNYIFNNEHFAFRINKNNIKKYYDLRYNELKNRCRYMNLNDLQNVICHVFFNTDYENTLKLLENSKNLIDISKYKKIINCNKDDIIEIIDNLKYEFNITNKILTETKFLSKKKLAEFLHIKMKPDLVELKGENFYTLVHKIKGFDNWKIAQELCNNPENWYKYKDENSYICTSAINQDFIGIVDGDGYILGFNDIKPNNILTMCSTDMYSSKEILKDNITNLKAIYTDPETLINNSYTMYNEVVLKRYNNGQTIDPDFVFVKNDIKSNDSNVSSYFNIPIVKLDSEIYADMLMKKYYYYVEKMQFQKAENILTKMVYSFYDCGYVVQKHFSNSQYDIENLQKYINISNKYELKELFKLVQTYNFLADEIKKLTTKNINICTCNVANKINNKIKKLSE